MPIKKRREGSLYNGFLRCVNRGRNLTRSTKVFYLQHLNVLLQVPGGCGTKSTKITHRCGWWMPTAFQVDSSFQVDQDVWVMFKDHSVVLIILKYILLHVLVSFFFHLQRVKSKGNPCQFFF